MDLNFRKALIRSLVITVWLLLIVSVIPRYYDKMERGRLIKQVMHTMPPSAFEQKEFPRDYIAYLVDYCVKYADDHQYSDAQAIGYCACLDGQIVQHFTMKEYMSAADSNWDVKFYPLLVQRDNDIAADCTQKAFKSQ